jgi:3-oxoacyl-[acyl-carrier protein] reductase
MSSVFVTGGSRGIGLGIAARLANSGFHVVAIARSRSVEMDEAILQLAADGRGVLEFAAFDLTNLQEIPAFVKSLKKSFGTPYGLVNNVGLGTSGLLANMPDAQIERLVQLNVTSPIMFTKYVVRSMMVTGRGRIVNISSIVASSGYSGLSVYSATKSSFNGFARALAREVGPLGITVNNVAPGFIDTDMTQGLETGHRDQIVRRSALRRLAGIEDIADAVEFLFSEKAKNMTGTTLTIDAGTTA